MELITIRKEKSLTMKNNNKNINSQVQQFIIVLLIIFSALSLVISVACTIDSKRKNREMNFKISEITSKNEKANSNRYSQTLSNKDFEKINMNVKELNSSIFNNKNINDNNFNEYNLIIKELKLNIQHLNQKIKEISKNSENPSIPIIKKLDSLEESIKKNFTTISIKTNLLENSLETNQKKTHSFEENVEKFTKKIDSLKENIQKDQVTVEKKLKSLHPTEKSSAKSTYFNEKYQKMFDSTNAIVYQNIYTALTEKIFEKYGNPMEWDEATYKTKKNNGRNMITIGDKTSIESGIKVNFPKEGDYDLLWLRTYSQKTHECIDVSYEDKTKIGTFCLGFSDNKFGPESDQLDSANLVNYWNPIAVPKKKNVILTINKASTDKIMISGIAFSKNSYNYAAIDAYTIKNKLNGGKDKMIIETKDNIQLGSVSGKKFSFKIPVIPNGKDKIFFICSLGYNLFANKVFINGKQIESFYKTYDNPFVRYFNSEKLPRYFGARIPSAMINANENFINATIFLISTLNSNVISAGTHDF